jgi:hypothetical protein
VAHTVVLDLRAPYRLPEPPVTTEKPQKPETDAILS